MTLPEAILFDFDYTLADSSAGIIACANYALCALGLPEASAEHVRSTIGLSLADMFVRLQGAERAALAADFHRLFVQRADQIMAEQTVVYPFLPSLVASLRRCGTRLGILSTKFRYRIEAVLRREGLESAFEFIIGGEDVTRHKPDPEGLLMALSRFGCDRSALLYVGDSVTDAEAAARAEVPFAGVLSGVTAAEELMAFSPRAILPDASKLVTWMRC